MSAAPKFTWTRTRVLAAAALALGVVALAGNPYRGHTVTLDTQELAAIVSAKVDHVTAPELADWIVQNRSDYRLIDVRDAVEFAPDHIPTAENIPIAELNDAGLGRNEKIVLVSEGGIHSAQAWMLLRAQKYTGVYILFGGLEAWKDEVVFPVAPTNPTPEQARAFERAVQVSRFFGGAPRGAGADSVASTPALATMPVPTAAAPSRVAPPPASANKSAPPRKKKEGC